jgi:hypothetical protein
VTVRVKVIFADKPRSLPLEWSTLKGYTRVGSCLVSKYWTRIEVTNKVYITLSHLHLSPIFAGKARSLLLECSHIKGYTWVGSCLVSKYWTRVKVTNKVFITFSHLHLSPIFVGKARSLHLEWSTLNGYTRVGSCLVSKYWTRVEVTDIL